MKGLVPKPVIKKKRSWYISSQHSPSVVFGHIKWFRDASNCDWTAGVKVALRITDHNLRSAMMQNTTDLLMESQAFLKN